MGLALICLGLHNKKPSKLSLTLQIDQHTTWIVPLADGVARIPFVWLNDVGDIQCHQRLMNILHCGFWHCILRGDSSAQLYGFIGVKVVGIDCTEVLVAHRESFTFQTI